MRLYQNQPSGTVSQLRQLRRQATESEKALKRALREAFAQLKWRFRAPVGAYRVDFLCFSEKLVIEVDGGQHAAAATYDAARTRFIEREGYRMLRFWNNDVLGNVDGVIQAIRTSLSPREREGAHRASDGKGEGDRSQSESRAPSPRAAPRLAPLPMGEGS